MFILTACNSENSVAKPVMVGNATFATVEFVQVVTTPVTPTVQPPAVQPTRESRELENGKPLAARVNNEPVYFDVYQKQVAKFSAVETGVAQKSVEQQVLDGLLIQLIIEQYAAEVNLAVTDAEVEAAANGALTQLPTEEVEVWLMQNGLSRLDFLTDLRNQLITGKVFEYVTQHTPNTSEQIWLKYIRLEDESGAQDVIAQLKAGEAFELLAQTYSLDTASAENGGDLGWFTQGSTLLPEEVETIAFSLHPNEVSGPIYTSNGLYIIRLEDKDPARLLSDDELLARKNKIFTNWLNEQRALAKVERFVALY